MTQEEFRKEVERIRPKLVVQAHRYLGQTDEAEDVVQDAMLKLCLLRQQLRAPIDSFASVLVRNIALNRLRSMRKMESLSDIDTVVASLDDDTEAESVERLMHIVESLPPRQQTIIRLHDMEGMGYQEMSQLTGMSVAALRQSASRIHWHIRLRYLAAVSASVALLLMSVAGYRVYCDYQYDQRYAGSYVIIDGHRHDNLRDIRAQIERTLASAEHMESSVMGQQLILDAENDVLNSMSNPAERRYIEELLKD